MPRRFAHAVACVLTTLSMNALASTVYVADEKGGSVTVIDRKSGATKRFDIPVEPHNVDITLDGARLLATGSGKVADHRNHQSGSGGQLVLIDLKSPTPETTTISIGGHPAHVVPDHEGRFAYVSDGANNAIVIADLTARKAIGRIPVGTYPHGIRLSPDGRMLAVANMRSGDVSLIDIGTRKVLGTVAVGRSPVQVGFDPSGRHLSVSLNGENRVALVDVAARKVLWKADVGRGPVQVSFTTDGQKILVANQGSASNPDDRLSVVSVEERKTVQSIAVGKGAHGTAVADDGKTAYVTNTYADTLSVIDLTSMAVIAIYPTGKAPNGVAVR